MKINIGAICPVEEDYETTEYMFLKCLPVKDADPGLDAEKLLMIRGKKNRLHPHTNIVFPRPYS